MQRIEVLIIGGGLAGLTAALHLALNNISVVLFEKGEFPQHKVCGEYVSKEILTYLEQLGVSVQSLNPVEIDRLLFSTASGDSVEAPLPLGGLGVSRYAFDNLLFKETKKKGVRVIKETVSSVEFKMNKFRVAAGGEEYFADHVFGAFGKRSILDKNLNRSFTEKPASWLAIKSHYRSDTYPKDLVSLHNFKGGYCGLSKTETGAVNLCYLATYESFKRFKNPQIFQEEVLRKNPFLNEFFSRSTPLFEKPLSIAQVSFEPKASVDKHILFLGDAAGLIHPLCGNGMAMAVHSAKIASELLMESIKSPFTDREELEKRYRQQWKRNFGKRIRTGRFLQKILLNESFSGLAQGLVSKIPFLLPQIIKSTHGKPIA